MVTKNKPKTKKEKKSKIVSLAGDAVQPDPLYGDDEAIERIRLSMSPEDRMVYDEVMDLIQICKKTEKLTAWAALNAQRASLLDKYRTSEDDRTVITWDDAALQEASGG